MIIDCHNHLGADLMFYLRGEYPYAQDLPTLDHHGSLNGVDAFIVFPMVLYSALNLQRLRKGEIALEGGLETIPYALENRRMMEEIYGLFPEMGRRTLPFAMLDPFREQAAQIAQLRKLKEEYPVYGLKIQSTMIQSPIKSLLAEGRGFLELAREWDVPFLIHSSINPADLWAQAHDIVDIAEANPDIRFCAAHSCRFDKPALDRIAELPNCWYDCSAHRIHCELAVKNSATVAPLERRFPSDYSDPGRVLADMAAAYPEKLMWGSDSPFQSWVTKDPPKLWSTYREEVEALRAVPQPLFEKVASANTLAFLGLETVPA